MDGMRAKGFPAANTARNAARTVLGGLSGDRACPDGYSSASTSA